VTWPYAIDPQRSLPENEVIVATRMAADRRPRARVRAGGDRYPSVDALRRDVADAQRRRAPVTAADLGDWVRARIAAS
jgi:hypothetical protein